jgi:chromosome segregation ATPase
MSGFFHRRKQSASNTLELDTLSAHLHQQTNENALLKGKIAELKEAIGKNRIIFESFSKENEEHEKKVQEFKQHGLELAEKIKEQETRLKSLREEKFQLMTDKDTNNPKGSNVREFQDLLDLIDGRNESLMFKDSNDATWEIIRRDDVDAVVSPRKESI